jgi:lipid-binding SYLF domain-containing protein
MTRFHHVSGAVLGLVLAAAPLCAARQEHRTLDAAGKAVQVLAANPLRGIPPALLREAKGVAIIPNVVRAGLVLDGRFGRGVLLVRGPSGSWSNPVFVTLSGRGVGLQAGVEAADVVLVFRTHESLNHVVTGRGQLTLGTEAAVAVGPVGGESEAPVTPPGRRPAEVYAYSHARGLFAGVALEGDRLQVDGGANEAFYGVHGCRPADALAHHGVPAAEGLRGQLTRLCLPPVVVPVHEFQKKR